MRDLDGPICAGAQHELLSVYSCVRSRFALSSLLALSLFVVRLDAASVIVAQDGDAAISRDPASGTWALTAGGASLVIVADSARDFAVSRLSSPSGVVWTIGSAADSTLRVRGQLVSFGARA